MHEPFVWLTAFSFDTAHLKIRRCRWAWCPLRIAVTVCIHNAEIVLRVLIQVFGSNPVTTGRRFARERDIAFEYLISIAADLDAGTAAFEYLTAMRRSRPIALALLLMLMMTAAVMASSVSFALALSHHALEILVGHHPPLG